MTILISDNSPRISYTATAGQTAFTVPFEFFDASDLNVYINDVLQTLTTHYTVTGGDGSTGSITLVTGATLNDVVVITRDVTLERVTDFPTSGPFQVASLNVELDKMVAMVADMKDLADRGLRLSDSDTSASLVLANKDARKGTVLAFNATTGAVEVGPTIADTNTIAEIKADIALLADIQDGTVATNAITTVSSISSDVTTVSNNNTNVTTVAGNTTNINTVAGDTTEINTVAGDTTEINALSAITTEIGLLGNASVITDMSILGTADVVADMNTLGTADVVADMNTLGTADVVADMNTLATADVVADMNTLATAAIVSDMDTLADISTDITTVANISTDVTTAATNVTDITNFADVYIGASATDPTTRSDGSALQSGDLYFNTGVDEIRAYSGSQWVAGTAGTLAVQRFSGNGSTTSFTLSTAPASENNTQVYISGVYQQKDDYSVSGTTLTFSTAPASGTDNIEVVTISTLALGATDASLVTYTNTATGAVERTVENKLENELVSVIDFGADNTGSADTSSAVQAAFDSGASTVYVPGGTYRCDSTITLPKNVSLVGDGPQSVFDFSNATTLTDNECLRTAEGSYTALPALGSAVSKGDDTITFASAPSLSPGDVIVIYNDTDGSWSNWRTYYRAGEYARVMQVNGSTVTVDGVLHDDYAIADVDLYKLTDFTTCRLANFKVIGNKSIAAKTVDGINLKTAIDSSIENVISTQSSYIGISVTRCFNVSVLNCSAKDEGDIDVGGDYGLAIGNSQLVQVNGGEFVSARHGITVGGSSGIGRVSCRFLNFNGCYIATIGLSIQAADIHGNAEFVTYNNCYIVGGITPGGDNTVISNCTILYSVSNGNTTAYYAELKGFNHQFINNTVLSNSTADSSRGYFIDCGGNSDVASNMTRGGQFVISGNTFRAVNDDVNIAQGIYIHDNVNAGTSEGRDVIISDNTMSYNEFDNAKRNTMQRCIQVRIGSSNTENFNLVSIDSNKMHGSITINTGNPTVTPLAKRLNVTNNHLIEGDGSFIRPCDHVTISNNTFENMAFYGVNVEGNSTRKPLYAFVENNVFINCGWRHTSSSAQNANLLVWRHQNAFINNNHGFQDFETLRVIAADDANQFTAGETITGGSSGETATVFATRDPFIFVRDTASGSFSASETIAGSTSLHTATMESGSNRQVFRVYYHLSMYQNDNVWHDHNINQHGNGNYNSGNTTVTTTI